MILVPAFDAKQTRNEQLYPEEPCADSLCDNKLKLLLFEALSLDLLCHSAPGLWGLGAGTPPNPAEYILLLKHHHDHLLQVISIPTFAHRLRGTFWFVI